MWKRERGTTAVRVRLNLSLTVFVDLVCSQVIAISCRKICGRRYRLRGTVALARHTMGTHVAHANQGA